MRIDDNSYYVKYSCHRGIESAYLCHYIEVRDDGYYVDDYIITNKGFSYEKADWEGVSTDTKQAGTRILKRYFERWVNRINDCKLEIERLVNNNSFPYGKSWEVEDYLYFPLKEIYAEEDTKEAEEYPNEYAEKINKYNGPEFTLIHVTKSYPSMSEGYEVYVNEYSTDYVNDDEDPSSLEYYLDYIDKSRLIPKEVYYKAIDLIRSEASGILKEIKQIVCKSSGDLKQCRGLNL